MQDGFITFTMMVITTKIVNSNIHKLLVDNGNAVNILYLDAYKRMGLTETNLMPCASPLYGFTGDHLMPRGMIKLVVKVRDLSKASIVMTEFMVVEYLSIFNSVIGRPLLETLKVVTSIYYLRMKFPH